tara:strand:+ start:3297 stop:3743 length:447 start_codon:yes stop_codon:yes gene_type:complete
MADSKVSDMTAATAVAAADKMYLVQSSASKSVTNAILFGNVATPTVFNDKLSIGDHDTITTVGAVSLDTNVTFINDVDAAGNLTLAAGVDGQIKIIIMSSNSGSHTVTLNAANIAQDISWDATGESATLLYDTGTSKWYFIGGSASVS